MITTRLNLFLSSISFKVVPEPKGEIYEGIYVSVINWFFFYYKHFILIDGLDDPPKKSGK